MFKELDTVVLTKDIKKHGLKRGDLGTIVHLYGDNEAFEVEFVTATGRTVALIMLKPTDIRSAHNKDVLRVRSFASA